MTLELEDWSDLIGGYSELNVFLAVSILELEDTFPKVLLVAKKNLYGRILLYLLYFII